MHGRDLNRLARIEGQVRGIRRMVEEESYCIDIINQIQAAQAALGSISRRVLRKHMDHCVSDALHGKSKKQAQVKIEELVSLLARGMR